MDYRKVFRDAWNLVKEDIPSKISSPSDCVPLLEPLSKEPVEKFVVLTLNGGHEVIRVVEVSMGLVNKTIVHPREVFRPAIIDNAVSIIIAHNHPSGNLDPSSQDRNITKKLKDAGEVLNIDVLDHIIVSERGFYSMLEEGIF
jgi:DNA repair protein RadC